MFKGLILTNTDRTPIMSIPLPSSIITQMSKETFINELQNNIDTLIIKFGAEWCGPCKKVEPLIHEWMSKLPVGVKGAVIDIDDNFELYSLLKSKKVINGVPVIICYKSGNVSIIPDSIVIGSDINQINTFFTKCLSK